MKKRNTILVLLLMLSILTITNKKIDTIEDYSLDHAVRSDHSIHINNGRAMYMVGSNGEVYDSSFNVGSMDCATGEYSEANFRVDALTIGGETIESCSFIINTDNLSIEKNSCPVQSVSRIRVGRFKITGMDLKRWNIMATLEMRSPAIKPECIALMVN